MSVAEALNITFDKEYISYAGMKLCKERAKEFKSTYKASDLLDAFVTQNSRQHDLYGGETIVFNKLDTFEDGSPFDKTNCYRVYLILDMYSSMYKVQFYINQNMEVSLNDDLLWSVEKYRIVVEEK